MATETRDIPAAEKDRVVVKCSIPAAGTFLFAGKRQEPVTLVIFGASGDLAERKLIPALYRLFAEGGLPESFVIFGSSLLDMTNESFRDKMEKAAPLYCELDRDKWRVFASRMFYRKIDYRDPPTYANLGDVLDELEGRFNMKGNRIYDLAIPPSLYEKTIRMLGEAGLAAEKRGWARIVIEKPFGRDLATAVRLNRTLHDPDEDTGAEDRPEIGDHGIRLPAWLQRPRAGSLRKSAAGRHRRRADAFLAAGRHRADLGLSDPHPEPLRKLRGQGRPVDELSERQPGARGRCGCPDASREGMWCLSSKRARRKPCPQTHQGGVS